METLTKQIDELIPDWIWNSTTQLIIVLDHNGYPVIINDSLKKVLKRPFQLGADSLMDILKYPSVDGQGFLRMLESNSRKKFTIALRSGVNGSQHMVWTDWEFAKVSVDGDTLYIGSGVVSRDIIEKGMYKSISNAILDGALLSITDPKGLIIAVNNLFTQFTQFTEDELLGKRHNDILDDYHTKQFWRGMMQTIKSGQIWNEDVMIKIRNGEPKWLHTIVSPVLDLNGDIHRIIHIQFDVSDYKKLLKHKEILKEIAFVQSHEFRRPVANMLGILDLIRTEPELEKLPPKISLLIDMLRQSVEDTDEIIAKIVSKATEEE